MVFTCGYRALVSQVRYRIIHSGHHREESEHESVALPMYERVKEGSLQHHYSGSLLTLRAVDDHRTMECDVLHLSSRYVTHVSYCSTFSYDTLLCNVCDSARFQVY